MKRTFLFGVIGIVLISMAVGCKSTPKTDESAGSAGPERVGEATFLENPMKPDGIYELPGGIALQFMGETWVQTVNGSPFAAGKLEGLPAMPPGFSDNPDDPVEERMRAFIDYLAQMEDYWNANKAGDISIKADMIYLTGKWYTLDDAEKMNETARSRNRNPLNQAIVSQDLEDGFDKVAETINTVKEGFTVSYELTKDPPFIVITQK